MADLTLGRLTKGGIAARIESAAIGWVARKELVAVLSIMFVAALLRFWDLGDMALHHDESLHTQFSWYLYHGDGFKHDPLMHGPLLFHMGAAVYFLFGDSEMTARFVPAFFGTILVGMPYLLRRQIGMRAVIFAAVLLTFSPTLLYYSRFYRNEAWMLVWTMGMVICIWRYLDEQKKGYLWALAAIMALSFASKEVTFITVAILLVFIDIMLAIELAKRRQGETITDARVAARAALFVPIAWLIAALWPLLGTRPFGRERLPPVGDVMVVLGTLSLPQFSAGIQQFPLFEDKGYQVPEEATLRNSTVIILLILSAYAGLVWRPKVWLGCAAAFYVPFVLLYTTFFSNPDGFMSGIWGSLDYWLDQHHVQRGNQPGYYYALLTPLYEFLPLLAVAAGAAWLLRRGDSLRRWLVFWIAGIFLGLSIAGEKMPWLEAHIALPLALAAAVILARLSEHLRFEGRAWRPAGIAAGVGGVAVLLLVDGGGPLRVAGMLTLVGLAVWSGTLLSREGRMGLARGLAAVAFGVLLTLTARASLTAAFTNDDTPVEMLVYTQTSHDVVEIRDRIDALAQASGLGYNLPIVVDSADGYAWPWAWYLRNYHAVQYASPNASGYRGPEGAVLLINQSNAPLVDASSYSQTPYKHRWWFEETYRDLTLGGALKELASWDSLQSLGRFFLHRRPATGNTGAVEGVAFFPETLAGFDQTPALIRPPAPPNTIPDGRTVIGRTGSGRGELLAPTDVFVDHEGNIWVADSRNNRVQKFDKAGNFLALLGRGGTAAGQFNEPWSVAVDREGYVYVADTWNHRIQRFSPELTPVAVWGQPAVRPVPGPLDLFGPRDILLTADGNLLVTDTGNKRLLRFSPTGEPLGSFGSEGPALGQFAEPVGLAQDTGGRVYVADAWNGRIQRLERDLAGATAFNAGWTSQEILAKPYLTVLADGRILAAEPDKGLLLLFDAGGAARGSWRPEADAFPVGVAALPDGGFIFSDARRNHVQIVPGALLDRLFR
jgi:predicted membrane-bound mannosyltransferase/DNA-binding beta-propeller fold protein YncE